MTGVRSETLREPTMTVTTPFMVDADTPTCRKTRAMTAPVTAALKDATFFPYWLDSPDAPAAEAPLSGKLDCDLAIVGGGFTGLWAAILAKETDPKREVVLIEAERIAHGASGRPGAIVSTSVMHGLGNAKRIFPRDLDRLEVLGRDNMAGFRRTIAEHRIDCDQEWNGELTVAVGPEGLPVLREEYDLHRAHGHEVQLLDETALRGHLRSPIFSGGLWSKRDSGTVHPAKLAWGLKRAARALGVQIYEHSPMGRVEDLGMTLRLQAGEGVIEARRALFATNAFAAGHPRIRSRVAMLRDRILMTEPLSPEQMSRIGWGNRQGVYDTRTQLNYMRLTRDNRILFGGRLGYYMNAPRDPRADRGPAPYEGLAEAFFTTFPQLDDIRFTHAWSGPIALTTRMAVHFQSYYDGKGLYAGGYSGFGVSASRFGARIGLARLDGGDDPDLDLEFARTMPAPIPPEPFRYLGARLTLHALDTVDRKGGWRRRWIDLVTRLGFPLS